MNVSPVSFGSLMVFKFDKPGNQVSLKDEISLSFPDIDGKGGNSALKDYQFTTHNYEEKYDGTVWNANKKFARQLDKYYRNRLNIFKSNPKKVVFTEVDSYVNPFKTKKKYFLTASSDFEEAKLHKILCESKRYYVARW